MLRDAHDLPPVTALLGLAEDGTPLYIRLPSPDVAHVLVSGTTGSGKTALLRTMVLSIAMRHALDDELALVLVDPKGGRAFGCLGGLPQLARPVVVSVDEAVEALRSLVRLMEKRDHAALSRPAVVVIIDELADLMMVGGAEPEQLLTRLVQRGREAGIHIVGATQKPSAAVIGGLIKSNFPVRLVGKVTSARDAQTAAGWPGTGAERLLGKGDFLAVATGSVYRFQAAYANDSQIAELVGAVQEGELPRPVSASASTGAYEFEPLEL
jgi:S-DNA-T family DNA segregation ATPase FtsK/SpoIIIE